MQCSAKMAVVMVRFCFWNFVLEKMIDLLM